jgi:2,3-bisphosphoglycerate-dependent phosphoglycerate mutase
MSTERPDPPPPVPGVVPSRHRTVHLATHPEATHHVDGLVGGQFDSDLTARGHADAARIAAELRRRIDQDRRVAVAVPGDRER